MNSSVKTGFYISIVILMSAIVTLYYYLGQASTLPIWAATGIVSIFILRRVKIFKSKEIDLIRVAIIAYMILSLIGLLVIVNYISLYGLTFGPYSDDSFYLEQIKNISSGYLPEKAPTLYEYFMAIWYSLIGIFYTDITNVHLLPINWAIGSIVVALAIKLAMHYSESTFPLSLTIIALLGNSVFTDSIVNLYRDGFILMMYLLALINVINRNTMKGVIFSFAAGLARMANGLIALIGVLLYKIYNLTRKYNAGRLQALIVLIVLFAIIIGGTITPFSSTLEKRSYGHVTTNRGFIDIVSERSEIFMTVDAYEQISTVQKIFALGPIGYPLIPIINLLAPIRFIDLFQSIEVHIEGYSVFYVYGVYPRSIWLWITVLAWIVIGPDLLHGIIRSTNGTPLQKTLFYLFIIILLGVSFVSFQPRHRLAYIILFPAFISISKAYPKNYKIITNTIRASIVILIIIFNRQLFL